MEILWLAIVFYSIGLGLVLQLRPSLMFHENGTWKEFGYQRTSESRHTLFPFWLFSIAWAFASYVLAATIIWTLSSPSVAFLSASSAITALTSNANTSSRPFGQYTEESEPESEESDEEDMVLPVKKSRGRPRGGKPKPRPGYYIIDPSSKGEGIQRYVYYGETPPPEGTAKSKQVEIPSDA